MGGDEVAPGEAILNKANVPTFPYPDTAARVFDYMAHYSENLRLLYETPMPVGDAAQGELERECADSVIQAARDNGVRRGDISVSPGDRASVGRHHAPHHSHDCKRFGVCCAGGSNLA